MTVLLMVEGGAWDVSDVPNPYSPFTHTPSEHTSIRLQVCDEYPTRAVCETHRAAHVERVSETHTHYADTLTGFPCEDGNVWVANVPEKDDRGRDVWHTIRFDLPDDETNCDECEEVTA